MKCGRFIEMQTYCQHHSLPLASIGYHEEAKTKHHEESVVLHSWNSDYRPELLPSPSHKLDLPHAPRNYAHQFIIENSLTSFIIKVQEFLFLSISPPLPSRPSSSWSNFFRNNFFAWRRCPTPGFWWIGYLSYWLAGKVEESNGI